MSSCSNLMAKRSSSDTNESVWQLKSGKVRRQLHTYFHGISEILNAEKCQSRIFWLIVVISSVLCATWMSNWLLTGAMRQRTVAKIEYLTPDTLKYPTITICDRSGANFLNYTKLSEDNIDGRMLNLMLLSGPIWILPSRNIPNSTLFDDKFVRHWLTWWQSKHNGNPAATLKGFLLHYSLSCKEIFSSCRDPNWGKLDCCQMFMPIIHMRLGICYATNPDFIPPLVASGFFSNLYLKLKRPVDRIRDEEFMEDKTNGYEITIDTGVDQGLWRADGLKLDFGYWSVASFSARRVTTDSTTDVPCDIQPKLEYFQDYTFSNCMWERRLLKNPIINPPDSCMLPISSLLAEKYLLGGTLNDSDSIANLTTLCPVETILSRIYDPIGPIRPGSMGLFTGLSFWMNRLGISSENPCDLPCDFWEYTYTVTSDYQFEDRMMAGLTLTMRESQYSHIREVPSLEWVDYVALIGGTWGLWTGGSVVAVIHMLVELCKFLCCWVMEKSNPGATEELI